MSGIQETITKTLKVSQITPVYVPHEDSIRVFKKIHGDSWRELDRVDLMESQTADTYSYDSRLYVIMLNPLLIGNQIRYQYTHDGVPNPGVPDLLASWMAEKMAFDHYRVRSGLYMSTATTYDGLNCGSTRTAVLEGGLVTINNVLFSVGTTHYDLNHFGAASGDNTLTTTLFYIDPQEITPGQRDSGFILAPSYKKTMPRKNDTEGRAIGSSYNELNKFINSKVADSGLPVIELLRMTIVSGPTDPSIFLYYDSKFRVPPAF